MDKPLCPWCRNPENPNRDTWGTDEWPRPKFNTLTCACGCEFDKFGIREPGDERGHFARRIAEMGAVLIELNRMAQ
jgi:hypothetical protein